MKLIKRLAVSFRTLIIMTGFCVLMISNAEQAKAQYPSASFTSNVFSGCAPLSVDFTNLSTQATNYSWDFGNGNVSSLQDPTTVYLTSGFFTVTLVAINNLTGNRDTLVATNYIHVLDNPVAAFSAAPLSGCAGNNTISFTNLSVNASNYIWDFGDGSFSVLANPVHTYATAGVYTVKLIAGNAQGCNNINIKNSYVTIFPAPPASFTVSQQSSCDVNEVFNFTCTTPGAITWQWNFGDGSTSLLQNPSHVYGAQGSFTITLIISTINGCIDTLVSPGYISIGPSLVPSFTVNTQTGCAPETIDFTCTVQNATSWLWNFGDGTTSILENPSHNYTASGSYSITLDVTTSIGCNGSVTLPAFITIDPLPVASFSVNTPSGCMPHTTFFTNNSTGSVTWLWNFGDGTSSTNQNPFHTYADTGIYNVTLTAYSLNGCQSVITLNNAVTVETLTAAFTGSPRTGCAPLPVSFTGSATPAGVLWNWDFGDGFTGTGQTVSHTYAAIGNYTITLVVTSAAGCTDTVRRVNYIRVVDDSTAYTVPDTIKVCLPPGVVSLTDPTIGSNSWLWDFGDGTTATVKNPTHTYLTPGVFTVTLTTGMAGGCTQTFNPYAIIEVIPFVVSPITSVITSACSPYTVQFDNPSLNVASYLWDFGDGTTSTLQNPLHAYLQPGTYTISLQIVSVSGCLTSLTTTVTFGYQNVVTVSDTTTCLGDVIQFGLNPLASFTAASWDFGDGTTSNLLQPSHIYAVTGSYTVSVTVTDISGCVFTFTYPNNVWVSDPVSSFSINQPTSGCAPYNVQFVNNSTGANGYYWYFGDGTNSNQANPSHVYDSSGTYTVTLNASRKGCVRIFSIVNYITVNEAAANFSFSPDSGCSPLSATFTDQSINAVSWLWNFGDGTTSNVQNPAYTFISQPTTDVSLIITDTNGCVDTISQTNVTVIVPDIQMSDTIACNGSPISFSTSLNATSYLWDFGDGSTSSLQNPVHTYTQNGSFQVTLTCQTSAGCTATASSPGLISISAPVSDFMSPTVTVCAPSLVNLVNQSTGATSWMWDFGDGTTAVNENPSHIYNIPGSYTVTLISYSPQGCADTLILVDYITVPGTFTQFAISDTAFCANTTVQFTDQSVNATSWFWNFGDGSTSSDQHPVHNYTIAGSYTVTLITTDSVGCFSFYSYPSPIEIYPTPQALGNVTPALGCTPLTATFTNSSTGALSYTWNFGNGTTSASPDTVYTYTIPGIYYPYLVASSNFSCNDTFVYASGVSVSGIPVPSFNNSFVSNCAPATVTFTNTSTGILNPSYSWNFGNGQTSTLQNPVISFNSPGVFQITLVVTNIGGCSNTIQDSITIADTPFAGATVTGTGGCTSFTSVFTNTSVNASSYSWNFGDGSTSNLTNPSHTYSTGGNYIVTLIATNTNGCTDTLILPDTIDVTQTPSAGISLTSSSGCTPHSIVFNSNSTQLSNAVYSWNFGNGQTGNQQSHTVIYANAGVYDVSLVVTNNSNCNDTAFATVTIYDNPSAIASTADTAGCAPYTSTFVNTSLSGTGYIWNFGDGTSSTQVSPSHTYTTAGYYTVTLIVNGSGGCSDTLVLPYQVHVKATPSAAISPSALTGCTPFNVLFSNNSGGLVNPSYLWNFGNGAVSNDQQPDYTYTQGGSFPVSLLVTNSEGCTDTAGLTITANASAVAQASAIDTAGCAPHTVTFNSTSLLATDLLWDFGDGTTSDSANVVHTYLIAGVYQPILIATTPFGCADTLIFNNPVNVNPKPQAAFSVNQNGVCSGSVLQFTNQSLPGSGLTYQWNIGGLNYSVASPAVLLTAPGFYDASLIVVNQFGCSDTMIQQNYLQVYDTMPPVISPIMSVSVVNNVSVDIIWQNNTATDLGAYILYRFNPATNIFDEIFRDTTPNNSSMNVTSSFMDTGLNTLTNVYTYKLQTSDRCAYTLPLSALTPHTTINVTATPVSNNIRVNWTSYSGCAVGSYEINRVELASGTTTLVATVPANTLSYLDPGFDCPDAYSYRIKATALCGTNYISYSDTSIAVPANLLALQKVEVVRSTVVNDHDVLTEWLPPVIAPSRVVQYDIYRSDDNVNFTLLASLPATSFSYFDYAADVHLQEYYYRVDVINDCMVAGAMSNNSSSILLKSDWREEKTKLWWTPYKNWGSGVDYYIIEKENNSGQWIPLKTVDGTVLDATLDE